MPEEFAAAYRAAYEQALAAQTDWAKHRNDPDDPDDPDDDVEDAEDGVDDGAEDGADDGPPEDGPDDMQLPVRRGPIRVGTHRTEDEYDDTPTWFERIRDSHWFVPLLLALLALLLVFAAYAVGRRFAERMEVDSQVSRTIVTGPSLASSTVMSAPNTPRSTRVPKPSSAEQTAL